MNCVKCVTLIPNYFEDDIDSNVKVAMNIHIASCPSCQEKLAKRKELLDTFKCVLSDEEIHTKSRRDEIINNINSSKYTGSIANKTFYHLFVKRGAFIGVVAAVFLMFFVFKHGENVYNIAIQYGTNISENNKVIDSILDFTNLKVGSYQGSEVLFTNISPDGNYLLLGTSSYELDIKSNKSLYLYDLRNDTRQEIATNFNMREKNINWYNNIDTTSNNWIVSVNDAINTLVWDVDNVNSLEKLPADVKVIQTKNNVLSSKDLEFTDDKGNITKLVPEPYIESFGFKDNNTLISVPYIEGIEDLKLMDFQVIEISISEKIGKVTFRP